ncbi:MAG: hypothetical protein J0665_04305 [Deltaproteobacteria bacterium]|nr:hypothetical protein [Deltaproteobacteria bacterium]
MEFIQPLAILGMILLGFGVMFRVVRPKTVFFFVLLLLLLPMLLSMIKGAGVNLLGSHLSWQAWIIVIFAILFGLRILIDRIFRGR